MRAAERNHLCYNRVELWSSSVLGMRENWREKVYKAHGEESDFFASPEWRERKAKAIRRDKYTCQRCANKRRSELQVHHIIPRDKDGHNDLGNLITLCGRCHDIVELDEALNTRELIQNSEWEDKPLPSGARYMSDDEFEDERPDWHAWVYGGYRNPQLDRTARNTKRTK